jgi:hypothetical protein
VNEPPKNKGAELALGAEAETTKERANDISPSRSAQALLPWLLVELREIKLELWQSGGDVLRAATPEARRDAERHLRKSERRVQRVIERLEVLQ